MLILRLLIILSALAIIISGGMYVFTRNPRYLSLVWQIVRFIGFSMLIFAALYILERFVLVGWRVLL